MEKLTNKVLNDLIEILRVRFEENMNRHPDIKWEKVLEKLLINSEKVWSLNEMEKSGGEPDVIEYNANTNEYIFYDCSKESPIGRRNLCYDNDALNSRKDFKPSNSAMNMAKEIGIKILDEEEYKKLQQTGDYDLKTSSWLNTPLEIRKLGGAIFGDKRYNNCFIYHNGAESYYGSRGFRGSLNI